MNHPYSTSCSTTAAAAAASEKNNNTIISSDIDITTATTAASESTPVLLLDNNLIPINNKNVINQVSSSSSSSGTLLSCPCCGLRFQIPLDDHHQDHQVGVMVNDLRGLPSGVKFDPTDVEILEHLDAKASSDITRIHPLIDGFIPTIEGGGNGICYTHPENLPGVSKDGQIRHFFHRPSKAYTTGTRKRRKVDSNSDEADQTGSNGETRWHKTGKTRPVLVNGGVVKGFKKILVLYTNYGRQRKPEKTNWVMHQYHLGDQDEERDGELVVSKVFYQTHPRQTQTTTQVEVQCGDMVRRVQQQEEEMMRKNAAAGYFEEHQALLPFVSSYHQQQHYSLVGDGSGDGNDEITPKNNESWRVCKVIEEQ